MIQHCITYLAVSLPLLAAFRGAIVYRKADDKHNNYYDGRRDSTVDKFAPNNICAIVVHLRIHPGRETTSNRETNNSPDDSREDGRTSLIAPSCSHISYTCDKGYENISQIPVPRDTVSLHVMRKIVGKVAADTNSKHANPGSISNSQKERYGKDKVAPYSTRANTCADTADIKCIKRCIQ